MGRKGSTNIFQRHLQCRFRTMVVDGLSPVENSLAFMPPLMQLLVSPFFGLAGTLGSSTCNSLAHVPALQPLFLSLLLWQQGKREYPLHVLHSIMTHGIVAYKECRPSLFKESTMLNLAFFLQMFPPQL